MITVNGSKKELSGEMSLLAYLVQEGFKPDQIAVELNEKIIPKTQFDEVVLNAGDVLEILTFMGGGQ